MALFNASSIRNTSMQNLRFKNIVSTTGECYAYAGVNSKGLWNIHSGGSLLENDLLRFHVQLVLMFSFVFTFYKVLRHLNMSSFTSEILTGLVIGRTVFERIFPVASNLVFPRVAPNQVMASLAKIALILFTFLTGVRMDTGLLQRKERTTIFLGIFLFLFPLISQWTLTPRSRDEENQGLMYAAIEYLSKMYFNTIARTNFVGVSHILMHLKITNSRIGHLALSSSLLCEFSRIVFNVASNMISISKVASPLIAFQSFVLCTILFLFIFVGLRRMVSYLIRRTPEGKPMSELYTTLTIMVALFMASVGDLTGFHYLLGPLVFGLTIPARSPLAEVLTTRYEGVISGFLIPLMNIFCASKVDVWKIFNELSLTINFQIAVVGFIIYALATFGVVLCCKIRKRDAAALTIILLAKGVIEVGELLSFSALELGLTESTSGIFLVFLLSAFQPTMVKMLYDPEKRYIGHRKKCIEHSPKDLALHIVVCAHKQDDALAAIKLLQHSNPTKESSLHIYGVCQEELLCSATPLLINHQLGQTSESSNRSRSQPMIDVFRYFHRENKKLTDVDVFTVIAPLKDMHEDACWLAFQKTCSLIILPFHKKWKRKTSRPTELRQVNLNILERAPCSVGILVDRRSESSLNSIFSKSALYRVAVLFVGGRDDREALAYALRMAGSSRTHLAVIHFMAPDDDVYNHDHDDWEKVLDAEALRLVRNEMAGCNNIVYKEMFVKDGADITAVVKSYHTSFDLIIVGRRHERQPKFLSGLAEWSELPELGPLGDLLASDDIEGGVSALIVQQQIMKAINSSALNHHHGA